MSEAGYRANLIEMVERARRFGARHVILSTNHPTLRHKVTMSGESLDQRRQRYNDHVREVATLNEVELCDIEEAFIPSIATNWPKCCCPIRISFISAPPGTGSKRVNTAVPRACRSRYRHAIGGAR